MPSGCVETHLATVSIASSLSFHELVTVPRFIHSNLVYPSLPQETPVMAEVAGLVVGGASLAIQIFQGILTGKRSHQYVDIARVYATS